MTPENYTILGIAITACIFCGYIWVVGTSRLIKIKALDEEARWWLKHGSELCEQAKEAAADGDHWKFCRLVNQHEQALRRIRKIRKEIEKV